MPSSRRGLSAILALLFCLVTPLIGFAHPMGNFSVNHYTKITVADGVIEIRYLIDMAEIPTYQEMQESSIIASPADPSVTAYLPRKGEELKQGLRLSLDGKSIPLRLVSREVIFPPGAGGLPTMKLGFVFRSAAIAATGQELTTRLEYVDNNFSGRAGWKEIVLSARGGGLVSSSVSQTDRSAELSNYPTDLLNSPPQDLTASIVLKGFGVQPQQSASSTPIRPQPHTAAHTQPAPAVALRQGTGGGEGGVARPTPTARVVAPQTPAEILAQKRVSAAPERMVLHANQQATPHSAFTELISAKGMSFWFLFTAAGIALGLGALHALEPGHGKTIVAAYLVGSRGTARHAVLLGIIVTMAHTAGVFALGAVTLYASHYIVPEQLYPWLGTVSGLTIAGLGGYMFLRRWVGADADHSHVAGESHSHWYSRKANAPSQQMERDAAAEGAAVGQQVSIQQVSRTAPATVSLYQLLALGITGGIIPCPAALVVLLSAFALHRIGLGFFLIIAFSVGLAAVLITIGMMMVYARRYMSRLQVEGPLITRWLPLASSAFMLALGCAIAVRAFMTTGITAHSFSREKLGPFLFVIGLGLILGMRHSTDPDHVVAVSTFVSKQRSIRDATLIGMMWGIGHTLTIFLVGAAIIIFGVVIPPRIGLSMEFCVALMLILLGVLNLTGIMRWITERFSVPWRSAQDRVSSPDQSSLRNGKNPILARTVGRLGLYQCIRPLAVGTIHGLAGSAAVALLVLSTIRSPLWATAYLLIFGAGTMVGMMFMTTLMAVPLAYSGRRITLVGKYLGVASGLVSVAFGAFLVYQIGFHDGLFSSSPRWTPH